MVSIKVKQLTTVFNQVKFDYLKQHGSIFWVVNTNNISLIQPVINSTYEKQYFQLLQFTNQYNSQITSANIILFKKSSFFYDHLLNYTNKVRNIFQAAINLFAVISLISKARLTLDAVVCNYNQLNLMMIPKTLVTIIPKKFFYLADLNPPKDVPKAFFFNIDNDLVYQGFFEDFGPLNIAKVWKYINEVQKFLTDKKYNDNVFYHFTSPHFSKSVNSALLVCCYLVVVMKKTPEEAFEPFKNIQLRPYRDAGYGQCSYKCTILDCLRGLHYAMKLGWFQFKKFDIAEYQHYEKIQNGDLNWVIPQKMVAFSSPYDKSTDDSGNLLFTPKDYVPIFKKLGVTTVVRLNNQTYNSNDFKQQGIKHHQLFFTDGTCPPKQIVEKFLEIAQSQQGAIAVHCKAGLGRTGTLIACYAIKHYHFNAADLIGWIRLCRPGSILGPQQYFLLQMQESLKMQGELSPIWKSVKSILSEQQVTKQLKSMSIKGKMNEQQTMVSLKGDFGQGNKLIEAKKKHEVKKK